MNISKYHYIRIKNDYDDVLKSGKTVYAKLYKGYYYIDAYKSGLKTEKFEKYEIGRNGIFRIVEDDLVVDHMYPRIINKEEYMRYFRGEINEQELCGNLYPNNGYEYKDEAPDITLKDLYLYTSRTNSLGDFSFYKINGAIILDPHLKEVYKLSNERFSLFDPFLNDNKHLVKLFIDFIHLALDGEFMYSYQEIIESMRQELDYIEGNTSERSLLIMSYFVEIHSQESNYFQFNNNPKLLDIYKEYLDILIEKDNLLAIRAKAYLDYEGAFFWPVNYLESEKLLLRLVQNGDDDAINTLGYLYYYHNPYSKLPDYEKAFKYFSLGAINNHAESKYKLADMLYYGYGIERNQKLAYKILSPLYHEQKELFLNGNHIWKFADVSLRMALIHQNINLFDDRDKTLRYSLREALEAKLAIKKRMDTIDYLGDEVVNKNIYDLLAQFAPFPELPKEVAIKDFSIVNEVLGSLKYLKDNAFYKFSLSVDETSDEAQIAITLNKNSDSNMEVILPEYGEIYLTKKIVIRGEMASYQEFKGRANDLDFDFTTYGNVSYLDILDRNRRMELRNPCLVLPDFLFNRGKIHQMAAVLLTDQKLCDSMPYYFIADGFRLSPNDRVLVESKNGPIEATVYKVLSLYEAELDYSIKQYRKVLSKLDEDNTLVN